MLGYETRDYDSNKMVRNPNQGRSHFPSNLWSLYKYLSLVQSEDPYVKWVVEVPSIMLTIELRMVIMIGKMNVNDFNDPKTSRYIDMQCLFIISFPILLGFME